MDAGQPSNGEMSELERRLLEAARHDRVPDALGARMAEGLGVSVTPAALHGGPAAGGELGGLTTGTQLGAPLFAKTGLWGVLSVALVTAGVAGWQATRPPPPASAPQDASSPSIAAGAAAASPSPRAAAGATDPVPARQATRTELAVTQSPAAAPEQDAVLHAEVALLDRARTALRSRQSGRALRLLDQHRARFAPPRLAPEAAALRIEALVQRGAHEQAAAMSRQFVDAHPAHPLRERVAKLVATAPANR